MYKITAYEPSSQIASSVLYNDAVDDVKYKLVNPKLTIEDNAAGSLTFTMPTTNVCYTYLQLMTTIVRVEKQDQNGNWKCIWTGRPIQEDKDFWNQRIVTCEGALAFLNDTTQKPYKLNSSSSSVVTLYLNVVLANHNSMVTNPNLRINAGATTGVIFDKALYTDYEKTISSVNRIIDFYGGHLFIDYRKPTGASEYGLYMDYLSDSAITINAQWIEFGKNLMDFTRSFDTTEYATVIVPLGKKLGDSSIGIEGVSDYVTVETATSGDGTRYVKASQSVINTRGWIEKIVHFDDIDNANDLYTAAQRYLSDIQFDPMEIEISAFDMSYLNPSITSIEVGKKIHVVSEPHGIDRAFIVKKVEIPLDEPENTIYHIGDKINVSLTQENNKVNNEILKKVDKSLDETSVLDAARQQATAIMNSATTGYVTILQNQQGSASDAIYVSDTPYNSSTGFPNSTKLWRWNMNGLGYSDNGGTTWKTAWTIDGGFNADFITAGQMSADRIDTTDLYVSKVYSSAVNGSLVLDTATNGNESDITIGVDDPRYSSRYSNLIFKARQYIFSRAESGQMADVTLRIRIYDNYSAEIYPTSNSWDLGTEGNPFDQITANSFQFTGSEGSRGTLSVNGAGRLCFVDADGTRTYLT